PEQAQGQDVDYRSDLYSLGCCLYEMVTGQVPFTGSTPVAIAYKHIQEEPMPPRALNPGLPGSLERVILKAMAKRPEDRYQTAVEMQRDLERVRVGEPVTAAIPRASQQTTRAMGAVGGGLADRPTRVMDRGAVAPRRSARYAAETVAPPGARPRRGRAALFVLATILLSVVVAFAVVKAVQVPEPTATTLPPISTDPPRPPTTDFPTTTEPPTTAPPTTAAPTTAAPPTTEAPTTTERQNELVEVPDTRGMRVNRAIATLRQRGFEVARRDFPVTNPDQENRVLEQVPRGGQRPRGSTITIIVGVAINNG
ncbi:MAG TPA: PASTA domain-containing protein, partial [Actinomycetota bacterium]